LVCALAGAAPASAAGGPGKHAKLDGKLNARAGQTGSSRVIIVMAPGADVSAGVKKTGGKLGRRISLINGQVAEVPNGQLRKIADLPGVASVHWDRPTRGANYRTSATVGARYVRALYGYNGAGVGVAVIDSGVTAWHDDLMSWSTGGQRVSSFVDFVNGQTSPYDDFGHGTHVSGIIAGNGLDSAGVNAGIAPAAQIVSLKVLDGTGAGVISNVIAALDYAVANQATYNIRVINLSVGASITESYQTDPLTLAAKRAVDAGIVVVTAAGNRGKNALGQPVYGGITAPGNAPWVITVGASSTMGTVYRYDDVMTTYSSRGPTRLDYQAKPDLVAPGTGTVSLSNPNSLLYITRPTSLIDGLYDVGYKPYLSLTGTSMSAPVVSGTVALMIEANPNLTPNLVKALLQYTAQVYPGYNALTEGAGFLNAKGAVDLARFFATAQPGEIYPTSTRWGRKIIWGNHRISGGVIKPNGTAWHTNVVWGAGEECDGTDCDNIVWGTECETVDCDNIVWGTEDLDDNIVWGTASDDPTDPDNIVWGTFDEVTDDNIVWGTGENDDDNIVWGTDCEGADCDNIVWGTGVGDPNDPDNIVWGTADDCEGTDCDNIVWGTADDDDNIGWGIDGEEQDNIVWGTADGCDGTPDCDNIVWGTDDDGDNIVWGTFYDDPLVFEDTAWDVLFEPVLMTEFLTTTSVTLTLGGGGGF